MSGISFTGVGSGIDTKTIVNVLVSAEIQPQRDQLSTRKTTLDAQLSSFGRLKSALSEFQSVLDNLKSPDKFQVRSTTVGDESRFTATSKSNAQPGEYQVSVENLAKSQRLMTADNAFASSSAVVGSGTLTISTGGAYDPGLENGFTVDIDPSAATLDDIRKAINNAEGNDSVTASIVNVDDGLGGTQARLILTARETGIANELTIAVSPGSDPGLSALASGNLEVSRAAEDAVVRVNGLTATRSTNEISDVIQGVTLNLKSEEVGEEVSLTIGTDNTAIEKNVQSFVDAYNKLQGVLKDIAGKDTSGLRGDSTVRMLSSQMRSLTSSEVSGTDPESRILAQVGVNIDKDGKMSLDKEVLNERLNQDFDSVSTLFSSETGIASRLNDFVKPYTQAGGLLDNRTEGVNSRLRSLADREERLDIREENLFNRLSRQFNAMDSMVAQINSNGAFLTSQLSSLQY
ncbi:flagellar filament capping protein FliD [Nitrincola sp.]|uniref:flagellar filament capping protein FliD n=1 Tax=Nitrincola sp. TaxID=1926584 RepID=UPI003A8DAB6C